MSTTLFIPSTISTWKNLDLNIINSLNISCLNLGLNKILLNLRILWWMVQKTKVYSLQANSIKYMSYFHKDKTRICLRCFGWTQFASRDYLSFETRWEYLSSRRRNRKLTTFYNMHNTLCPQYLGNCLPLTE